MNTTQTSPSKTTREGRLKTRATPQFRFLDPVSPYSLYVNSLPAGEAAHELSRRSEKADERYTRLFGLRVQSWGCKPEERKLMKIANNSHWVLNLTGDTFLRTPDEVKRIAEVFSTMNITTAHAFTHEELSTLKLSHEVEQKIIDESAKINTLHGRMVLDTCLKNIEEAKKRKAERQQQPKTNPQLPPQPQTHKQVQDLLDQQFRRAYAVFNQLSKTTLLFPATTKSKRLSLESTCTYILQLHCRYFLEHPQKLIDLAFKIDALNVTYGHVFTAKEVAEFDVPEDVKEDLIEESRKNSVLLNTHQKGAHLYFEQKRAKNEKVCIPEEESHYSELAQGFSTFSVSNENTVQPFGQNMDYVDEEVRQMWLASSFSHALHISEETPLSPKKGKQEAE
jgi:hypothetical protein